METHQHGKGYILSSKNKVVNKKGYILSSKYQVTNKGGYILGSKRQHAEEPSVKVKSKKEKRAELYLILATLLFIGLFFFTGWKILDYRSETHLTKGEIETRICLLILLFFSSLILLKHCKRKAMFSDIVPYEENKSK